MSLPRDESPNGPPLQLCWEAWRHCSDGVAILSQNTSEILHSNTAFGRICQAHDLTPDALAAELSGYFGAATSSAMTWRLVEGSSGQPIRAGLLRLADDPTLLLLMAPAAIESADIVTGLADRRLLEDELERRFHSAWPFVLVFVDLDGFKQVNDGLGHASGDLALREIAQRIRGSLRERDIVGRYGGDEFVVLLDGTVQPEDLQLIVERIRSAAAEPLESIAGAAPLSASLGWAFSSDGYDSPAAMLAAADSRMYASKRNGS